MLHGDVCNNSVEREAVKSAVGEILAIVSWWLGGLSKQPELPSQLLSTLFSNVCPSTTLSTTRYIIYLRVLLLITASCFPLRTFKASTMLVLTALLLLPLSQNARRKLDQTAAAPPHSPSPSTAIRSHLHLLKP
jgi:hypothetical protein